MQLNNRIVHISVQLFSGVDHAYRMVEEKSLHYIIVKWMRNMFAISRTVSDPLFLFQCERLETNLLLWDFICTSV